MFKCLLAFPRKKIQWLKTTWPPLHSADGNGISLQGGGGGSNPAGAGKKECECVWPTGNVQKQKKKKDNLSFQRNDL
jgi:hypothetical protein